jgi:[ribosomal protein S18]-alanine N-acetyltransferase
MRPDKQHRQSESEPPAVQVRRLSADDLDAVTTIIAESPEAATWSRESHAKLLGKGDTLALVAEELGEEKPRVAGFLVGRVAGAEAEVLNLAVALDSRRRGYATRLLRAAIEEFVDEAAEWVYIEVRESNAAAIACYEKEGFSRSGLRKGYYRQPEEAAVIMSKPLDWDD